MSLTMHSVAGFPGQRAHERSRQHTTPAPTNIRYVAVWAAGCAPMLSYACCQLQLSDDVHQLSINDLLSPWAA